MKKTLILTLSVLATVTFATTQHIDAGNLDEGVDIHLHFGGKKNKMDMEPSVKSDNSDQVSGFLSGFSRGLLDGENVGDYSRCYKRSSSLSADLAHFSFNFNRVNEDNIADQISGLFGVIYRKFGQCADLD